MGVLICCIERIIPFQKHYQKKISLFPVIFSLYYLLYFLYKTSNKIFEISGKFKSNKNIYAS